MADSSKNKTTSTLSHAIDNVRATVVSYEDRLNNDPEWAMSEGSRYFDERSAVHDTLHRITKRLSELQIPYAVVGGMALFRHGYRRFTEDVGILVTREGLKAIHDNLSGRGYIPPFTQSKNLRDTENGTRIEFVITEQYPGDGKPKPVAFPDPDEVATELDGINFVNLQTLVELKLASGLSATDRAKDLIDVQELIKLLKLPREYADQLNPYVHSAFDQCWQVVHSVTKRYRAIWRNKWLTADAGSIDDMILKLREAADQLEAMKNDGVQLDADGGTSDDYANLITGEQETAQKYDMHDESEFIDEKPEDD